MDDGGARETRTRQGKRANATGERANAVVPA